ncbi:MAG: SPOR domain-containing protein [Gammaproteobacteria bacterium]|nr:SPOR domain-containing protein [Gammaproteobacteria bacterium]MCF6230425.1 SPOR domain-containing protein [Gammaproteobacteria bacterium]
MARDYKNSSRSKAADSSSSSISKKRGAVSAKRKPESAVASPRAGMSPVVALSLGLGIGLSVAAYIYFVLLPDSLEEAAASKVEVVIKESGPTPSVKKAADVEGARFDFYSILPTLEVIIPDQEIYELRKESQGSEAKKAIKPIKKPGRYLLQAGSFRKASDAERVKVELAFLGVESYVEPVVIDNSNTWYRVRVGPFDNNKSLDKIRNRLLDNQIEVMVLKVKEG